MNVLQCFVIILLNGDTQTHIHIHQHTHTHTHTYTHTNPITLLLCKGRVNTDLRKEFRLTINLQISVYESYQINTDRRTSTYQFVKCLKRQHITNVNNTF